MTDRRLVCALLLPVALLSGCSYVPSWMGGRKAARPIESGERITVLPMDGDLKPDPLLQTKEMKLPEPKGNADWPAHSGNVASDASNLAGSDFTHEQSVTAGEGAAYDTPLVNSPVAGGGMVFAMDGAGAVSAHSIEHIDTRRWESPGVYEEDQPLIAGGGMAYSGGRLFVASGRGLVVALDAENGKELWRKALKAPVRSAPMVSGGRLYATTLDNQLFVLKAASGDIVWTQRGINEATGLMKSVSPAIAGEMVVAPYSSGEVYVLFAPDGKEVWSTSLSGGKRVQSSALFASIGSDPVVDGSVLFVATSGGSLSVKSLATGQPVWDIPVGSTNTPWIAGDYAFVLTSENVLLGLFKYDGHIRWSLKLPTFANEKEKKERISWKGPVLVEGKLLLVSSHGQLVSVNARDGAMEPTREIPENIYTAPVVAGGRMFLMGQDATLYALH